MLFSFLLLNAVVTSDYNVNYSVMVDVAFSHQSDVTLWNPFESQSVYSYPSLWLNTTDINNKFNIQQYYPQLSRIQIFNSIGGCYIGYKNCTNNFDLISTKTGEYNFTQIQIVIDNILRMNLIPHLVISNIPISMSNPANIGSNNINTSPPDDILEYHQYLNKFMNFLISTYSLNTIQKWYYGIYTEYNNYQWFKNPDNESFTQFDFYNLYDWTSCSLNNGSADSDLIIGTHSCFRNESWPRFNLLQHIANGTDNCTQKVGDIPLKFYSTTYYEYQPEDGLLNFDETVCDINTALKQYGLNNVMIGIDEGGILYDNDKILRGKQTGLTFQASYQSLLYVNLIRCNVAYYSQIGFNVNLNDIHSNGQINSNYTENYIMNNIINPVSLNANLLINKLKKSKMTQMNITNNSEVLNNQIFSGIASVEYNENNINNTNYSVVFRVYLFNHLNDKYLNQTVMFNLTIHGIPLDGYLCNITKWVIDDYHSQFWTLFWEDIIKYNITSFDPQYSNISQTVTLNDPKEREFMMNRIKIYQNASKLFSNNFTQFIQNNKMIFVDQLLQHHAINLFEIFC